MTQHRNMRHSPLGRVARQAIHLLHKIRYSANSPRTYRLPEAVDIRMYPEGEVAEFLSFPSLFERNELQLVTKCLKPGMRVIDVGANIGLYSILAACRVGNTGHVWAFEPSRETYERLVRNLHLNDCRCVQPLQIALGESPDRLGTLTSDRGYGDAYRYLLLTTERDPSGKSGEVVSATTLDACAVKYGMKQIDLIKIDVEGGEYRVLLGARETLAANCDVRLVFESEPDWCERAGCKQEDAFNFLRAEGFRLYSWDAKRHDWSTDEGRLFRAGMVWAARRGVPIPVHGI